LYNDTNRSRRAVCAARTDILLDSLIVFDLIITQPTDTYFYALPLPPLHHERLFRALVLRRRRLRVRSPLAPKKAFSVDVKLRETRRRRVTRPSAPRAPAHRRSSISIRRSRSLRRAQRVPIHVRARETIPRDVRSSPASQAPPLAMRDFAVQRRALLPSQIRAHVTPAADRIDAVAQHHPFQLDVLALQRARARRERDFARDATRWMDSGPRRSDAGAMLGDAIGDGSRDADVVRVVLAL